MSLIAFISYSQNTKFGTGALASNTTGFANSAFGYQSLRSNTQGNYNTAHGYQSLYANTSGRENTAVGAITLSDNTTGYQNTAVGIAVLRSNTIGSNNTAVGNAALLDNTTGIYNSAFGDVSLIFNTTGSFNTATGSQTLGQNTSGFSNTASGYLSMFSNVTGSFNTANGYLALYSNTTGNSNTAVGNNADAAKGNLHNSSAIGNGALVTASNQVRIGNCAVTSIGGYVNWSNISDGRFKKNVKDNIKGLGFILKLKPVSYNLDITGLNSFQRKNMKAPEGKKYIAPEEDAKEIKAKEQIIYNGFVAQDVEKAAKDAAYVFSGVDAPKNDNDVYGLRYADFVVPLVKAVQELSAENEELKSRLAKIEEMLTAKSSSTVTLSTARLEQNAPNPFNQNTMIRYYLPQNAGNAFINITDANGKVIKTVAITSKGSGQIVLQSEELAAATYQYSLFVNGKLVDAKKMVLLR
jgi:hypothetical protein